MRSKVKKKSY